MSEISSYISLHIPVKAITVRGIAAGLSASVDFLASPGFFKSSLMVSTWVAFQTNLLDLGLTVETLSVSFMTSKYSKKQGGGGKAYLGMV